MVEADIDPHAGGVDHFHHCLSGDQRGTGIGGTHADQAGDRGDQMQIDALADQSIALGAAAQHFLLGGIQIGARGPQARLGDLAFLAFGLDCFLADGTRLQELFITLRLGFGKALARRDILNLRLGGQHIGLGTHQCGIQGADAVVEIDRVHLAQHLACLDPVAHLHGD